MGIRTKSEAFSFMDNYDERLKQESGICQAKMKKFLLDRDCYKRLNNLARR